MEGNYSLADVAAATRGNDYNDMGAGGWWVIILFALIFGYGGNGFGGRGGYPCGEPVTEAGLCNSMNFNNLENAVGRLSDNQAAIARQSDRDMCQGFAAVNAAINQSRFENQQCCCETQRAIDNTNFNLSQATASINATTTAQTQKILDTLCGNRMADMQNQINQLQLQAALCGVVRYPNSITYGAGASPFCSCNSCGCSGNI